MKIVVLSFKIADRQNDIRNQMQRSPGSIFHEFEIVWGALAAILDVLGSSVLEIDFQRILKRSLGHLGQGTVNSWFLAVTINNQSGLKSRLRPWTKH